MATIRKRLACALRVATAPVYLSTISLDDEGGVTKCATVWVIAQCDRVGQDIYSDYFRDRAVKAGVTMSIKARGSASCEL